MNWRREIACFMDTLAQRTSISIVMETGFQSDAMRFDSEIQSTTRAVAGSFPSRPSCRSAMPETERASR
jgi:hypothetical protein